MAAAVVLAVAVLGTLFAVVPAETAAGTPACLPRVDAQTPTDAELEAVATGLRTDPRVAMLTTETKEAGYARFQQVFADKPEVVASVPFEAFPAVARFVLVPGADAKAFIADATKRFPIRYQQPECILVTPPVR